jgi:hypothetical protein
MLVPEKLSNFPVLAEMFEPCTVIRDHTAWHPSSMREDVHQSVHESRVPATLTLDHDESQGHGLITNDGLGKSLSQRARSGGEQPSWIEWECLYAFIAKRGSTSRRRAHGWQMYGVSSLLLKDSKVLQDSQFLLETLDDGLEGVRFRCCLLEPTRRRR